MVKVAPEIEKELLEKVEVTEVAATLEEVVKVYQPRKRSTVKQKKTPEKETEDKGVKNNKRGYKRKNFTPEMDSVIKAAMADGDINCCLVAKQLNRSQSSISNRVKLLKMTGGARREVRRFTLTEDIVILESLVLQRVNKEKLYNIVLHYQSIKEVAEELGRIPEDLTLRWSRFLQPTLLQHYTGTLNLRVEVMLANYLLEHFASLSDVNWSEVAARREFAGHTVNSLKNTLSKIVLNATKTLNIERADVTLRIIAEHSEQVYGEGGCAGLRGVSKINQQRQQEVISFFEGKVGELGLVDFL